MPDSSERIVFQCKLHRGIFLVPLLTALPLIVPAMAYLWLMNDFFRKLGPTRLEIHFPWLMFLLPGLIIGLMSFFAVLIAYLKSEIVLTEDRLRFKVGWLSVGSTEILLSKIETITLWEPLIGRIAGYGTVGVRGTGGTIFRLRYLPNPQYFHSLLQTMVNGAYTRRPTRSLASLLPSAPSAAYDDTRYTPKG
jgi:hypothetical protein